MTLVEWLTIVGIGLAVGALTITVIWVFVASTIIRFWEYQGMLDDWKSRQ